ncbi:aldehyde dehydrogenase family protein [Shouchella sp. 1P09AA]|uniref:aldehyde dehydrogenase family protein n=1 Tax=unclassified Shouchella TaxID=2893065 RepID=UPI0039A2110B
MIRLKTATSFINGEWVTPVESEGIEVRSPYLNELIGHQYETNEQGVEEALASAITHKKEIAKLEPIERSTILYKAATLMEERQEELAKLISSEVGKALKNTRDEVGRSIETLIQSAEEAKRQFGETIPGGASSRGKGSTAITFRVPVGVIAAITPFNAPLNLICHKIGPSFAAGNVTVLKPAPQAPLIAAALVELLLEAGMPAQAIQMVLGGREVGEKIVEDSRTNLVSFTGGVPAGQQISKISGMKKVLLELGGNAGTIVHEDADVDRAATLATKTAFSNSGQSCISVQRVYVHESIIEPFSEKMKEKTAKLYVGDPRDERTDIGCVVAKDTAERITSWIEEAVSDGAEVIHGGSANGAQVQPTILMNPKKESKVVCQEVFGPVVSLIPYRDLDWAINEVNDSEFGLQAGLFTKSLTVVKKVTQALDMGGIIINGTSNFRLDHWPYGGVKHSGIGREGPRFAVEEMSETKMIVLQDFLTL